MTKLRKPLSVEFVLSQSIKKLNDDEWYEMTVQLKKWFNKNVI